MASISTTLLPERVIDIPNGKDREGVLESLVGTLSAGREEIDAERLIQAVLEREALASTGFGDGLAMPHVRLDGVSRFYAALGRTRAGVEFHAIDGAPVHLLLLIVGPEGERTRYQRLLGSAATFLKAEGTRLKECDDLVTEVGSALLEY